MGETGRTELNNDQLGSGQKTMIRLSGVDKIYRLGEYGTGTLYRDLQTWWAKRRGRPDPNRKIGQEELHKGDSFYALKDIDLTIHQGERLGIIGGNGAGKSTLLKLISRVTSPSSGQIDLYGRVTSMLEVGTGFHSEMTGRENIYLNGAILGMNKKEINEVLEDIIDFSEVREFIDTPVKRYSSGMYVKLAFSVAAHLQSEIVIMDEVLAVGDLAFQEKCIQKMLQAAQEESRTILYVSHNMKTVRELCDRCIVLDKGRIVYDGNAEQAISYYSNYLIREQNGFHDYSTLIRQKDYLTGLCSIDSITLPQNTVRERETLQFSVRFRSQEAGRNILLRLIISTPEGTIVGMTYSDAAQLSEEDAEISYLFDTGELAPGVYSCDVIVLEYDGNFEKRHDYVSKAFSFSVEESIRYFGRPWERRSWGSIRLEPVKVYRKDQ